MLFLMFCDPVLDFMEGGTSHEMLIFVLKTFKFKLSIVFPEAGEVGKVGRCMGSFMGGVRPPMTRRGDPMPSGENHFRLRIVTDFRGGVSPPMHARFHGGYVPP